MACKLVANDFAVDVPHLEPMSANKASQAFWETHADDLVFCTRCQILAVWTEAHTTDVQITVLIRGVITKVADFLA